MLGNIVKIIDNKIYVKLAIDVNSVQSLANLFVLLQDASSSYIGEIINVDEGMAIINLVGEYKNNALIYGFIKKPAFNAKVDLISPNYVSALVGSIDENSSVNLGESPFYDGVKINADINALFGSHLAIFGSTGSGKSCGFAKLIQNLLDKQNLSAKMNLIIFDAYGEYYNAFKYLNDTKNPNPNNTKPTINSITLNA